MIHRSHSFVILLAASSLTLAIPLPAAEPKNRPNVLFISIDDMNDWVGCLGGHPDARTPNIDRLADCGTLFTNGHTAAPVCNPSRAAFLSGQGPFRTGIYHNRDPWPESAALQNLLYLPEHFHQQGYHTMLAGKIFHGPPQGHTNDKGLDEYGGSFGGQAFKVLADDFANPFRDLNGIHNYAVHWGGLEGSKAEALSDPKVAAWASDRLADDYDRPFLLMVGFHRPHTPLTSPIEFWDMFDREQLTLPPLNPNDLDDMPWIGRQVAIGGYQAMEGGHYKNITQSGHHRDVLKGYLAACTFVDAQIGKVIDALDRSSHRDNTIVVLFSDHGWGVGERYHFKKWGLWDDTTHIPYIVHVPGMTKLNSKSDAGVTTLDLYPTLVDLCGIDDPPHTLDGRSLKPLLTNPNVDWDRPALTTLGPNNHALRSPRWRYIRWSDGSEELYDHKSDPHEWHNLAEDPASATIKNAFSKWFPQTNVAAVATDHASPVRLTSDDPLRQFNSVVPSIAEQPITVRAIIGPEITDGVILSHGGQFCGYSLYVKEGQLTFSVMDVPRPLNWDTLTPSRTIISADDVLPSGKQLQVTGQIRPDGLVRLFVGGKPVAQGKAATLSIHPAGIMQLGMSPAKYVPVGDYEPPFQFQGSIEKVTVEFGSPSSSLAR